MVNPYLPPSQFTTQENRESLVQRPAIALIVVSLLSIVLCLSGIAIDVVLLVSGVAEELDEINSGPISQTVKMAIRSVWTVILLAASSFVLYGAMQMKNLRNYQLARSAAIVAMIPCVGPCCLLGIPFGIWAFATLGKPGVDELFE